MLTRRDRGWAIVRESLRRERRINDLLSASSAARRSRRVATTAQPNLAWVAAEQAIRAIEHEIRRLDPIRLDFWTAYTDLARRLVEAYSEAGVAFDPGG